MPLEVIFESLFNQHLDTFKKIPYKPPQRLPYGEMCLVSQLKNQGDGHDVNIYEARMPARFYKIEALPARKYTGELKPGFSLSTGSGVEDLVEHIAVAISEGMLGLSDD